MESYLLYIGKSAMALSAFYLLFLLFFQNQKQFRFNRIYLPVSMGLSFLIPLITFTKTVYLEATPITVFDGISYLPDSAAKEVESVGYLWYHYLFGIYLLGSAGFLIYLLVGHYKAASIIRFSRVRELFGWEVNISPKDIHPFSFFNRIVVSEKTLHNPNLKIIIEHEGIHIREKHTNDILFTELMFLLQWFNPFAWLLKDAVKNNLEYKTDHQITLNNNARDYQMAMVGLADKRGVAPFLTALNGSQLKNRIIMMKKVNNNKYSLVKQLLILPLLAILIMGLSDKEVRTEIETSADVNSQAALVERGLDENNLTTDLVTEHEITGQVVSSRGKPLAAVSVLIKGKPIGTITDEDGNFTLQDKTKIESIVVASPGYVTTTVEIRHDKGLKVFLPEAKGQKEKKEEVSIAKGKFKVEGKVTDENNNPVSGVSVIVKNKTIGTITNKEGLYQIHLNEKSSTLLFSGFGYQVKEVKTGGKSSINVQLESREKGNSGRSKKEGSVKLGKVNKPLIFIDGVESNMEELDKIDKETIQSMEVIKDSTSTEIYGEKAKNGVILVNRKNSAAQKTSRPDFNEMLIVVNDRVYNGSIKDIDPNSIKSVSVLKDAEGINLYGEKAKKGVLVIRTKSSGNAQAELPVVLNGKLTRYTLSTIDRDLIKSLKKVEANKAVKKYGDAGKNGVFEVTSRKVFYEKVDVKSTAELNDEKAIDLKLRKFIAEKLIYPQEAYKSGMVGAVKLFLKADKNGKIYQVKGDPPKDAHKLDDVVLTGYNKGDNEPVVSDQSELFVNEVMRVAQLMYVVHVPDEYRKKPLGISVKFELID